MFFIEYLIFIYICGTIGSLIGAAIVHHRKNLSELDLDAIFAATFLWPLSLYHTYNNELNRRAIMLNMELRQHVITQNQIIKKMSERAVLQTQSYDELKHAYDALVCEQDKLSQSSEIDEPPLLEIEGKSP